jgi:hypothetical protein
LLSTLGALTVNSAFRKELTMQIKDSMLGRLLRTLLVLSEDVLGTLVDLCERLAGKSGDLWLYKLKGLLRKDSYWNAHDDRNPTLPSYERPTINFGWMFVWAKRVDDMVKDLSEPERVSFLKKFIENWMSFRRSSCNARKFYRISPERRKQFLELVDDGDHVDRELNDDWPGGSDAQNTKPFLGMRLMYTWLRPENPNKPDQFRCLFGIPLEFSARYVETARKGLLFTVEGSRADIRRYIEQLLTEDEKRSAIDLDSRGCPITIFGLIIDRQRIPDDEWDKALE